MKTVLVTGAAGFIGFHVARRLLAEGNTVVGLDNLNAYYEPMLKKARLTQLAAYANFHFEQYDLASRSHVAELFNAYHFPYVVHLAAQAGVRYSLIDPHAYVDANLVGFMNVLEGCRQVGCQHLIYASSSSVYGANARMPLRTSDNTDHPLSLYGATKKANEAMAHAYSHLFALPVTGLRFFTVYGPWGRPDMAMWLFTAAILEGRPIKLFNNGRMRRDFTYIDDVTESVVRLLDHPASPDPDWSGAQPTAATSNSPWRLYNVGNSNPVEIIELVMILEKITGRQSLREYLPIQPGDVVETSADSSDLGRVVGFRPNTLIEEGARLFVEWFQSYLRWKDSSIGERLGARWESKGLGGLEGFS
jgi:UDP-glucuronate 4-epimerase